MPFEAEQHAVPLGRMCCFSGISNRRFIEVFITQGYVDRKNEVDRITINNEKIAGLLQ